MSRREDANLRQALAYARHGWAVFPCIPGEKIPATPNGFKDATTDEAQVRGWWAANPGRNIGVATGRPGPDVVDVDRHSPEASGFPAWNAARREGLVARPMAIVRTPSGGMHAYFQGSEQRSAATAAHVDFRSQGGYVVAPHSSVGGRPYVVVHRDPQSTAGVDFGAVRQLVDPQPERPAWKPPERLRDGEAQDLSHLVQRMAGQPEGNRDAFLFWASNRMLDHGQSGRLGELARAAEAAGLDRREIARTIESARQQQRQDPHASPQPRGGPVRLAEPQQVRARAAQPARQREREQEPQRARTAVLEADQDGPEDGPQREQGRQPEPEHQAQRDPGAGELGRPFAQPETEAEPEREAGE
jgi:hypothetical protein